MRKDHYAEPASDNAQPEVHQHGASCIKVLVRPGRTRKPLKRYFNKNLSNYLQGKFDEEFKDDIEEEIHDRTGRNATTTTISIAARHCDRTRESSRQSQPPSHDSDP